MGLGVIMATLKELLGEAYKDGMTVEEIETAIANKKFADLSTGAYVSVSKYQALERERDDFKSKWSNTLTEAQKAEQKAIEEQQKYEAIMKENALYKHTSLFVIFFKYWNNNKKNHNCHQNAYN